MKAGDVFEITIDDIGAGGEGIAHSGGYTVFVPYTLPGEQVLVKAEHCKKNLVFAKLARVLSPSAHRVPPECPGFGRCGGCDFLHLEYAGQLQYKKKNVETVLRKNAGYEGAVADVIPSEPFAYRNKIQLPFGMANGKAVLGFFAANTHSVVPVERCLLHGEWAEKLMRRVLFFVRSEQLTVYDEKTGKGLLRHLTARYIDGFLSVTLVVNGDTVPGIEKLTNLLKNEFEEFSLHLSVNKNHNNVIMGNRIVEILFPNRPVTVSGIQVEIHPHSFFQINDAIRTRIYEDSAAAIDPRPGVTFIDAFSGVGLLGAMLAKRGAYVYNIDIVPEAVRDSDTLYKMNGISGRATNIAGDAAKELPALLDTLSANGKGSLHIFLDPPRKGVDPLLLEVLKKESGRIPFTLHYLSCNPATLSRDLAALSGAFVVQEPVRLYDMFPNTSHIEALVRLSCSIE